MRKFQLFIVFLLAGGLVWGTIYALRTLNTRERERIARESKPAPFVHPITAGLEKARSLQAAGKLVEAQTVLQGLLGYNPREPLMPEVRELLGEINSDIFFSHDFLFGKTAYVVERGDSLWGIAREMGSTPELIMRTNRLTSSSIRPGQRLLMPDGNFRLTIDLPNERVVVRHDGIFFKQYPIETTDLPRSRQERIETSVRASAHWKDGERVAADSDERSESTPWIYLRRHGYTVYGAPSTDAEAAAEKSAEAKETRNPDLPGLGIGLEKEDAEELQLLLNPGTPVTIIRLGL